MKNSRPHSNFFALSIRKKLFLSSLLLLFIPWMGYLYIQDIENELRHRQQQQLITQARLVSIVLRQQPELFTENKQHSSTPESINHVYVRQLSSPIQLDGYIDDWKQYQHRMHYYGINNVLSDKHRYQEKSLSFYHQLGSYKQYLYVVFKVTDDKIIYRKPGSLKLDKSDHLRISMIGRDGNFYQYILTTEAPGWVTAHRLPLPSNSLQATKLEIRIKGEWQETNTGYNIEIRLPLNIIGNKIAFAIADVDDPYDRAIEQMVATSDVDNANALGSIIVPSPQVENLLMDLHQGSTRTWVIDHNYRVIAVVGNLQQHESDIIKNNITENNAIEFPSLFNTLMRMIYRVVLKQPTSQFEDDLSSASILLGEEFNTALRGKSATKWRTTPDQEVNILTATHPIVINNKVLGAIAIEQTSNSILLLQNRAMEILIKLSLLAFLISSLVLLLFASRLSSRVRRLRNDAENAISSDGRVVNAIRNSTDSDEIGDLSRSFSDMLSRLTHYNRYLESMASKLSHELRTPIAVVRSSLDNLEQNSNPHVTANILQRARDGINRLSNILSRMSEATRLEKTLQLEEKKSFGLSTVLASCLEGYRIANPQIEFIFDPVASVHSDSMTGAPELIAQLLDKLISNAIDFHTAGSAIVVRLYASATELTLSVINSGLPLPKKMQANLFESMVSIREQDSQQPHLGLGLYIVRLITQFHHGTVMAKNLDNSKVEIRVQLPKTLSITMPD